jgi:hypothetical protein
VAYTERREVRTENLLKAGDTCGKMSIAWLLASGAVAYGTRRGARNQKTRRLLLLVPRFQYFLG